MKLKKFIFLPIILVIVSIFTSIIAFNQSNKLDKGYIYVDENQYTPVYAGEYFAIIGNLMDEEYYIRIESLDDFLSISTYDLSSNLIREFEMLITEEGSEYNRDIVISTLSEEMIIIDEMEDYLFFVNLEINKNYSFNLSRVDSDGDKLNIALVNIPENIYNLKSLMESVSFTTLVFAAISGFTIIAIHFIRRRSE
ncbi:MAG: hypothetical protein RBQ64_04535 [Candidatus Izemoplasmatales bacterium]|jgi:hypothetical protein|nr:hypothetical protein [Candidatus Izemoplasmatales bacterium]